MRPFLGPGVRPFARRLSWPSRSAYRPLRQAKFSRSRRAVFDASARPQTVRVAPEAEVDRNVVVGGDLDPRVRAASAELDARSLSPPTFLAPPLLCSRVPNGAVATPACVVLTDGGRWIVESAGKPRFASRVLDVDSRGRIARSEDVEVVDRDVAVVFSAFNDSKSQNYWHWMIQGLTRAAVLQRAGVPDDVSILVPEPVLPMHADSLRAIGFDERRIVPWSGSPTRFRNVYLPTARSPHGDEPPATAVGYIRELAQRTRTGPVTRRLWVSRRRSRRPRVTNEGELIGVAESMGFEEVLAETLTVGEQMALFAEAEVIAGPHGAGLTNAIFMASSTTVVEVAPDRMKARQKTLYWNLAAAGRQRYAYCVGPGGNVDPRRLERLLGDLLG